MMKFDNKCSQNVRRIKLIISQVKFIENLPLLLISDFGIYIHTTMDIYAEIRDKQKKEILKKLDAAKY